VSKLNPGGTSLVYSTYLGGSGDDFTEGIAIDGSGNAYVIGGSTTGNFPTTPGAFQSVFGGGSGDSFVCKLDPAGASLVYSTYLGGSDTDFGSGIAIDSAGNAYVTGNTYSGNFPVTTGAFQITSGGGYDAFVTKLNPSGTGLIYSTYLGGGSNDEGSGIALDSFDDAYVTGDTQSGDFPTTAGAIQTALNGSIDAFVAEFRFNGQRSSFQYVLGRRRLRFRF
jgi:hypothetical protein